LQKELCEILVLMNSPRSKLLGITSASLRSADHKKVSILWTIPAESSEEFHVKVCQWEIFSKRFRKPGRCLGMKGV
jgi:hypothetical protein